MNMNTVIKASDLKALSQLNLAEEGFSYLIPEYQEIKKFIEDVKSGKEPTYPEIANRVARFDNRAVFEEGKSPYGTGKKTEDALREEIKSSDLDESTKSILLQGLKDREVLFKVWPKLKWYSYTKGPYKGWLNLALMGINDTQFNDLKAMLGILIKAMDLTPISDRTVFTRSAPESYKVPYKLTVSEEAQQLYLDFERKVLSEGKEVLASLLYYPMCIEKYALSAKFVNKPYQEFTECYFVVRYRGAEKRVCLYLNFKGK